MTRPATAANVTALQDNLTLNIEKQLECALCLERFHEPKRLHCNHIFCKDCLNDILEFMVDGSAQITCPLQCTIITKIPPTRTVKDLNTDIYVQAILESLDSKDYQLNKSTICEEWNCNSCLTSYCYQCNFLLCNTCTSEHGAKHQGGQYASMKFDERNQSVVPVCSKHKSTALSICLEGECNNKFICMYCKHRDHKDHYILSVQERSKQIRRHLELEEVEIEKSYRKKTDNKFASADEAIQLGRIQLENLIRKRMLKSLAALVQSLQEERTSLLQEYDFIANRYKTKYEMTDIHDFFQQWKNIKDLQVILRESEIMNSLLTYVYAKENSNCSLRVDLSDSSEQRYLGELKIKTVLKSSPISSSETIDGDIPIDIGKLSEDLELILGDCLQTVESCAHVASPDSSELAASNNESFEPSLDLPDSAFIPPDYNESFEPSLDLPDSAFIPPDKAKEQGLGITYDEYASQMFAVDRNPSNSFLPNSIPNSYLPISEKTSPYSSNFVQTSIGKNKSQSVEPCDSISCGVFAWESFSQISLKSHHGRYVGIDSLDMLVAESLQVCSKEHFKVEHLDDKLFALKANNDKYLGVTQNRTIIADRGGVGTWETFHLDDLGDGIVAIRLSDGKYLCAQKDGSVVTESQCIGKWEKFLVENIFNEVEEISCPKMAQYESLIDENCPIPLGEKGLMWQIPANIFLKSFYGDYVSINKKNWELFTEFKEQRHAVKLFVKHLIGNTVALKIGTNYVGVTQKRTVVGKKEEIGQWEKFYLVNLGEGMIAVKTHEGKYICAEKDGSIVANSSRVGKGEKFHVEGFDK